MINTFFLILYEMGMDHHLARKKTLVSRSGLKTAVRRIMGITQEAIRSTRYRILHREVLRSVEATRGRATKSHTQRNPRQAQKSGAEGESLKLFQSFWGKCGLTQSLFPSILSMKV
jgi:hypothetical protein